MLELTTLKIATNTEMLDIAIKKIQDLKKEMAGIKPMKDPLGSGGSGASTSGGGSRSRKKEADEVSAVTKAIQKKTETLKVMRNQEIEAADGVVRLGDAFTRSQSSALAMLKLLGATTAELKEMAAVFGDMNKIMGVDPFDKSTGNLRAMKKEVEELSRVNQLMNQGLNLSKKEVAGLSRDIIRLTEAMSAEKKSTDDIQKAVKRLTDETISLSRAKAIEEQQLKTMEAARAEEARAAMTAEQQKAEAIRKTNLAMQKQVDMVAKTNAKVGYMEQGYSMGSAAQAASMKMAGVSDEQIDGFLRRMKQLEDASKAARKAEADRAREAAKNDSAYSDSNKKAASAAEWLRLTEERLQTQLNETDGAMRKQFTDTLVKLRENLKLAGYDAAKTEREFARLEKMVRGVASKENARNLDNLARAVSVQMGDVGISLASGMNPLLVMIQQGDQIRGAIQQAGVSGKELQNTMMVAAKQIASSFLLTGQAIGGFFTGAIMSAGSAAVDFGAKVLGVRKALVAWEAAAVISESAGSKFAMMLLQLARVTIGVTIGAAATAMLSFAIGAFQAMRENDKLARSLALTNGALGVTHTQAFAAAAAFEAAGGNAGKFLKVVAEMGKTGELSASQMDMVAKAAIDLEKFGGVKIEDTIKKFADLQKDPVDALIKLQKETGMVSTALIFQVQALKNAGEEYAAGNLAVEEYSRVTGQQVDQIKDNYTSLGLAMLTIGEKVSDFWDKYVIGIFRKSITEEQKALQEIQTAIKNLESKKARGTIKPGEKETLSRLYEELRLIQKANDLEAIRNDTKAEQDRISRQIINLEDDSLSRREKILREISKYELWKTKPRSIQELEILNKMIAKLRKELNELDSKQKPKSQFEKDMEVFNDLLQNAEGNTSRFNNQMDALQRLIDNPAFANAIGRDKDALIELQKAMRELGNQQDPAKQWMTSQKKYLEDLTNSGREYDKTIQTLVQSAYSNQKAIEDESESLKNQLDILGVSTEAREKQLAILKAQKEYYDEINNIESKVSQDDPTRQALMDDAARRYGAKVNNILTKAHIDAAKSWQDYMNDISKGVSESLTTALIDGGKAGRKQLRNLIVGELRKRITLQIDAFINPLITQAGNALFGGATAAAAGGAAGSAASGALAGAAGGAAASKAATLATYAPIIGAALVAYNIWSSAQGNLIGKLAGRANIGGSLSSSGFDSRSYSEMRNLTGTFMPGNTYDASGNLKQGISQQFVSGFDTTKQSIKEMSEILGIATTSLDTFSYEFNLTLNGLSEEDAIKAIEKEFGILSDQMVDSLINLKEYQRYGESTTDTLKRMSTLLGQTNELFDLLNWSMYESSFAGYAAADSFVAMFGGIENATSSLNRYYSDFYTAQEKMANVVEVVGTEFAKLGLVMPTTKDNFRALVESIKASGNQQLLADVLKLSGAFSDMMTLQTESLADYRDLQKQLLQLQGDTNALRELELQGMDATAASLQRQIWLLEDAKEAQEAFSASLKDIEKNYIDAQEAVKAAEEKVQSIRDQATDKYIAATERVASATERIAEIQEALRETYAESAKTLRDFISGQNGSQAASFGDLIARAKSGDLDAIGSLTGVAEQQIQRGFETASTLDQARANRSRILAQVAEVASVLEGYSGSSLEEQILSTNKEMIEANEELVAANQELADALAVVTTIGAALVQVPQDLVAEFNRAIEELAGAVSFENAMLAALNGIKAAAEAVATNTNDLSPALQLFAQQVLTDVITTVNVVATSNLPDDLRALALAGNSVLERTVKFIVEDSELSEDDRKMLLAQTQSVAKTFQLIADSSGLTDNEKNVLLNATSSASRLVEINAQLSDTLTDEQRAVLAMSNQVITKTVKQVVESGVLTDDQRNLLTSISETVTRITDLGINDGGLTDEQKALFNLLGQANGSANLNVGGSVSWDFDEIIKEILERIAEASEETVDVIQQNSGIYGPSIPPGWTYDPVTGSWIPPTTTPGGDTGGSGGDGPGVPADTEPFARGGAFTNGIVSRPTRFSIGEMGEAGSEAIMPLGKMSDGSLGVVSRGVGNEELIAEIKRLNDKVDMLEAAARSTAQTNARIAKVLERVTPDGESLQVTTLV